MSLPLLAFAFIVRVCVNSWKSRHSPRRHLLPIPSRNPTKGRTPPFIRKTNKSGGSQGLWTWGRGAGSQLAQPGPSSHPHWLPTLSCLSPRGSGCGGRLESADFSRFKPQPASSPAIPLDATLPVSVTFEQIRHLDFAAQNPAIAPCSHQPCPFASRALSPGWTLASSRWEDPFLLGRLCSTALVRKLTCMLCYPGMFDLCSMLSLACPAFLQLDTYKVNIDCQFNRIQNQLGNCRRSSGGKPLGTSVRKILD